jgi:hypothetical protein
VQNVTNDTGSFGLDVKAFCGFTQNFRKARCAWRVTGSAAI